jgi:integrase
MNEARKRVRKAADAAGLPSWLTLDACRHGGMTELADSDLTEEQEMSLSGHTTPDAKRRYVKRTDAQRLTAARKRRAWILEQKPTVTQNGEGNETQNGSSKIA